MALPGPLTLTSTRFHMAPKVPRLKYPVFSEEPCSAKSLLSETSLLAPPGPNPTLPKSHRYGGYTFRCSDLAARKRRPTVVSTPTLRVDASDARIEH